MKLGTLAVRLVVAVVFLACASTSWDFTKDYFIWNKDGNGNSPPVIRSALNAAGYTGDMSSTLPNLTTLLNYRTVWICLGMFPNNTPLGLYPAEDARLVSYIDNDSTCAYMEGGDAWNTDPGTPFRDYFNLIWGFPGFSDLSALVGQPTTFSLGMTFDYSGDNAFVDRLIPDSTVGAYYLFKNDSPQYGVMVAYDNGNCTYKTIASSCEFAGLVDDAPPSTKVALAESIMTFFCTPRLVLNYDVSLSAIPSPTNLTPPITAVTPKCTITNAGAQTASGFYAHMRINPGSYRESTFVATLASDSSTTVAFSPDWTAGNVGQNYTACAWTSWGSDQRRTNDTLCKSITAWDDTWYIRSPWCTNGDSVVADGVIGSSEWADAVIRDVSDFLGRATPQPPGMAFLYVMNDSSSLYLALDGILDGTSTDLDHWDLFFEDNFSQSWPLFPDSSEGEVGFINHPMPTGPWFNFRPYFADSFAPPYWITLQGWCNNGSGHMQYEFIVPLGDTVIAADTTGRHHALNAGLCDTVGFWTFAVDEGSRQSYVWWPTSSNVGFGNLADMGMIILQCGLGRYLELEAVDILSPPSSVELGRQYPVTVRVGNNGNFDESFWVLAMIGDSSNPFYFDSTYVSGLGPGSQLNTGISIWNVTGSDTTCTMCVWIPVVDSNMSNNTFCMPIEITTIGVEELAGNRIPRVYSLSQNYPNPFSRDTRVEFALPADCRVTMRVFDVAGTLVRTLEDTDMEPGVYRLFWDGRNSRGDALPNGVYFLSMEAGPFSSVKKMMLLR